MRKPKRVLGNSGHTAPRETILLVDDEQTMRKFMAKLLASWAYRVIIARDGEEALSVSEGYNAPIHLLITDVMMPKMNGKELADRLCTLRPEIRVLFVSAFSRTDFWPVDACEDQTDWLPKPFSGHVFQAKVRKILDPLREP